MTMWRILGVLILGVSVWGVTQILPRSDSERELRSIVSIAVKQPQSLSSAPAEARVTVPAVTVAQDSKLPPLAAPTEVGLDTAYLPEGAPIPKTPAKNAGTAPQDLAEVDPRTVVALEDFSAVDVKAITGSTAVKPVGAELAKDAAPAQAPLPEAPGTSVTVKVADLPPPPVAITAAAAKSETGKKVQTPATERKGEAVAMLVPPPVAAVPPAREDAAPDEENPKSQKRLARSLQRELIRVGCFDGRATGVWGELSRNALAEFNKQAKTSVPVDAPDYVTLTLVQTYQGKACGVTCAAGSKANANGQCVGETIEAMLPVPVPVAAVAPKPTAEVKVAAAKVETKDVSRVAQVPPSLTEMAAITSVVTPAIEKAPAPSTQVAALEPVQVESRAQPVPEPQLVSRSFVAQADEVKSKRSAPQRSAPQRSAPQRSARPVAKVRAAQRARPERRQFARIVRPRRLLVATRYPSYQVLQASLFQPIVIVRPRTRYVQRVRSRARPAWAYTSGPANLPRYLR
jgi:hypothetical protein